MQYSSKMLFVGILILFASLAGCGPDETPRPSVDSESPQVLSETPPSEEASEPPKTSVAKESEPNRPAPAQLKRWAVVTTPTLEPLGFSDLLFMSLAEAEGIELVERQELDKVLQEQEFSTLWGEQSDVSRLKLGRLLNADALLILEEIETAPHLILRVLVVDVATGASLYRSTTDPLTPEVKERWIKDLPSLVLEIQQHFAGGVDLVASVPAFVSDSFENKYEDYELIFAEVLRDGLSVIPGVAVVSEEEALRLREEFELTGGKLAEVPQVSVSGRFKVRLESKQGANPLGEYQIAITGGEEREVLKEESVPLQRFADSMLEKAVPEIAKIVDRPPPAIPVERRILGLARRAEVYLRNDQYAEAVVLRRAILSLHPDSAEQRLKYIEDMSRYMSQLSTRQQSPSLLIFPHIEYLVEHRLVDSTQGAKLISNYWSFHEEEQNFLPPDEAVRTWPRGCPPKRLIDQYFAQLHLIPMLFPLPAGRLAKRFEGKQCLDDERVEAVLQMARLTSNVVLQPDNQPHAHRRVDDFITILESLPEEYQWVFLVRTFTSSCIQAPDRQREELFYYLTESDNQDHQWIADRIKFHAEMEHGPSGKTEMRRLLSDYGQIHNLAKAHFDRWPHFRDSPWIDDLQEQGEFLQEKLLSEQVAEPVEERSIVEKQIVERLKEEFSLEQVISLPHDAQFDVVQLEDWRIPSLERFSPKMHFQHFQRRPFSLFDHKAGRLNEECDFFWGDKRLLFVRKCPEGPPLVELVAMEKGIRQPEAESIDDTFLSVEGCGDHLWISTTKPAVYVVSKEGKVLAKFNQEDGLPRCYSDDSRQKLPFAVADEKSDGYMRSRNKNPTWRDSHRFPRIECINAGSTFCALDTFPISANRCVVWGLSDEIRKLWIGLFSFDPATGEKEIEILHTATRVLEAPDWKSLEDALGLPENIDVPFIPRWFCLYSPPGNSKKRYLLVGRCHTHWPHYPQMPRYGGFFNTPLAIDLETHDVALLEEVFPHFKGMKGSDAVASLDGNLVMLANGNLEVFREENGEWIHEILVDNHTMNNYIIPYHGDLLIPGTKWWRLSCDPSFHSEMISESMVPPQHRLTDYSLTANYGVCAKHEISFEPDVPYRFDFEKPTEKEVSVLSLFIPSHLLEDHLAAIESIRENGGLVKRYLKVVQGVRNFGAFEVYLPEDWRGGPEEMKMIAKIHDLNGLYAIGAPVNDAELESFISSIADNRQKRETFGSLYLMRTNVTNDGLENLLQLQISQLFLAAKPGDKSLGDEGIQHLNDNEIRSLVLGGTGFTQNSIYILQNWDHLKHLTVFDTSIEEEQLNRLKQEESSFEWIPEDELMPHFYF